MLSKSLTDRQAEHYRCFRDFVTEHVEPVAAVWDRERGISRDIITQCAKAGFVGGIFPQEYGGGGWDAVTFGLLNEAVGSASSSLCSLFTVQTMVGMTLAKWGTDDQRQRWLAPMAKGDIIAAFAMTEPKVGSDIQNIETTFTPPGTEGGCYVLKGTKKWITMSAIADIFLVFGKDTEGRSMACIVKSNSPGVTVKPLKEMMGFRGAHLSQIEFTDCEIPHANMVGKPGVVTTYVAPYGLHFGRISTAWSSVGLIRACLESSAAYASQRQAFGSLIMDHGTIRRLITEMGVNWEAAAQLCLNACKEEDSRSPQAIEKVLVAKYFASRSATRAATDNIQVMGAHGCHEENSAARYYRNAKIMQIIEGTDQVLQKVLGKSFCKKFSR
jgi:glutaryl-CoA dehydrogenase (non-decarboxylating)